ncbi:sigma-70 family RNA polymerase sigma factor [Paludisphaera mucosa]|uniref:Sigma-70 family RNA polymerase sigma factor n=1 Tax=Paludisphaera mucosa TaxID=3030827 RepID=A0ABT6FGX7_9BACT|nr:sigma-70 family RNA polymerase sigma factor [Paludisphaera mucosa]MDG3006843.1 sigma-70 family RNA polymerase sigma factor [Paludisphaera mucosa]
MRKRDEGLIVRDLDRLFRQGVDLAPDGELLWRFLSARDEDAFEAILGRHGPMVRGVCGRLLRDPHDADDAFQATFLVLARDGGKLRDPDRLASWLYSIARRVSVRARVRADRRRAEPLVADFPAREEDRAEWSDVLPVLDAELARLPTGQRDVLALCLLGGASEQEASRRLDCPVGTVKSRLSRAKEALRGRLVRRGIAPAAATAALASVESIASPVSPNLIHATLAAVSARAAIAPAVAALTQGVAPTMFSKPFLLMLAAAGGLGVLGLSATAWTSDPTQDAGGGGGDPGRPATPEVAQIKVQNLKAILLAMHNHHDARNAFPAAAVAGPDGRPLLSWRVALLPYLGEEALYKQFHLDEPWDGPHNRTLLRRMPEVYQTPDLSTPLGFSRFRGFTTPGAMFGPDANASDGVMMGSGMMRMDGGGAAMGMPGMMMRMDGGGAGMGMPGMMGGGPASKPTGSMMGAGMGMPGMMGGGPASKRTGPMMGAGMMMGGAAGPQAGGARSSENAPRLETAPEVGAGVGPVGRGAESAAGGGSSADARSDDLGVKLETVTDGTSNTVFLVVADQPIEWTKPEEPTTVSVRALDGHDPRGALIGLVDGSTQFLLDTPHRPGLFAALVTRSGGEIINWGEQSAAPPPPAGGAASAMGGMMGSGSMRRPGAAPGGEAETETDRRLRRVEEKLDRLLKKLDAADEAP